MVNCDEDMCRNPWVTEYLSLPLLPAPISALIYSYTYRTVYFHTVGMYQRAL
jgi:hypothetical protein